MMMVNSDTNNHSIHKQELNSYAITNIVTDSNSVATISNSSPITMASTMLFTDPNQPTLPKTTGTSFFIRDLLFKDVCKSPKESSISNSSDDDDKYALHDIQHESLTRFGPFYQNSRLPNGLSTYFDLSRINQSLLNSIHSSGHRIDHKNSGIDNNDNNLFSAETYAKLNGRLIKEGKF